MLAAMIWSFFHRSSFAFVAAALSTICALACANSKTADAYKQLPFPSELKRYNTRIFNLFDKSSTDGSTSEQYYDAKFVRQFRLALRPYIKLDPKLEKRLLSGPAPEGVLLEIEDSRYVFYTGCQAHACNTTNIAVLYRIDNNKLVGRLQYKCGLYTLGNLSAKETAAIEALSPIDTTDPFYQESCKYERQETK